MRRLLPSLAMVVMVIIAPLAAAAAAGIHWTSTPPESGEVTGDEVHVSGEGTHLLVVIENPDITSDSYTVSGSVRYEDVKGPGYLEMWSYFSDGGAYFSRTLAEGGPLAALDASSPARTFELPFFLNGAAPPERLEIYVVLPQGGDVWIGPLTLDWIGGSAAWWTAGQAGLIGAIGGTILGLAGALVGILARRGRGGRLVPSLKIGLGLGVMTLVGGIVAIVSGQPGHVWGPLLIVGGIAALVAGALIPVVAKRTSEAELHRIHALDS